MPSGIYQHKKRGKMSEEQKIKLSLSLKGRSVWNKGLKGVVKMSDETKQKMKGRNPWNKGKILPPHTKEWKEKVKKIKKENPIPEDEHASWKGDKAGKSAIHRWVEKWKGTPNICEKCGKTFVGKSMLHWANVDHKYRRVLDDFIRLCARCHGEYDSSRGLRNHKKFE